MCRKINLKKLVKIWKFSQQVTLIWDLETFSIFFFCEMYRKIDEKHFWSKFRNYPAGVTGLRLRNVLKMFQKMLFWLFCCEMYRKIDETNLFSNNFCPTSFSINTFILLIWLFVGDFLAKHPSTDLAESSSTILFCNYNY